MSQGLLHSSHGHLAIYSNLSREPVPGLIEVGHPKCGDLPSHITRWRVAVLGQNAMCHIVYYSEYPGACQQKDYVHSSNCEEIGGYETCDLSNRELSGRLDVM